MPPPIIRPARSDEYDVVARVWMESWVSTGLEDASNFLLAKLRARVPIEVENGWSLFVADDDGALAAMLALHLRERYLDQLFVAPNYQGRRLGRQLLAFTRQHLPDEIWLRCVRENEKAWRWYEREGLCVRAGTGRADDRLRDEILSSGGKPKRRRHEGRALALPQPFARSSFYPSRRRPLSRVFMIRVVRRCDCPVVLRPVRLGANPACAGIGGGKSGNAGR